jgi:hypothetical protein
MKSTVVNVMQMCRGKLSSLALLCILISLLGLTPCYGVESYVAWQDIDLDSESIIQTVCKLLGVDPEYIETFRELEERWGRKSQPPLMLITDTFVSGLRLAEKQKLTDTLARSQVNLMIVFDKAQQKGSGELVYGLTKYTSPINAGTLKFSTQHSAILKELAGMELPVTIDEKSMFLNVDKRLNPNVEPLMWVQAPDGSRHIIMGVKKVGKGLLYFGSFPRCQITKGNETFQSLPQVMPILIFLKKECGDVCWHRKTISANLTIDDPWLVEPYGNLSYSELIKQMEVANFHTTIAFTPWNYDRSRRDVVDLFLKNPERYSIAFHGNNHDRREFGSYSDHPFKTQITNIRQALGRMAEFTKLTGIPASQVMIFPHNIAPEKTLLTLKQQNFIATMNSRILPLGETAPVDADSMLWTATLKYYGFPVLQRFNPRVDRTIINILLFLEKPLLFYTHQDYFYKNIGAFNEVAQYVNERTHGKARWANLKQVCDNLYMERLRSAKEYDIRMMARSVVIKNSTTNTALYRIQQIWSGYKDIEKLIIGDTTYEADFEEKLGKPILLEPGKTIRIELLYKQPPAEANVTLERTGIRNHLIRWLSDFRDRSLSNGRFGRVLIKLVNYILHDSGEN